MDKATSRLGMCFMIRKRKKKLPRRIIYSWFIFSSSAVPLTPGNDICNWLANIVFFSWLRDCALVQKEFYDWNPPVKEQYFFLIFVTFNRLHFYHSGEIIFNFVHDTYNEQIKSRNCTICNLNSCIAMLFQYCLCQQMYLSLLKLIGIK